MPMSGYTKGKEENLVKLLSTIDTILLYKGVNFRARNLVAISKEKYHGQFFSSHLMHLVDIELLSESKTARYLYHVKDLNALKKYHDQISLLLSAFPISIRKLKMGKQF